MKRLIYITSILFLTAFASFSQEMSKWEARGYISNMQSVISYGEDMDWVSDNLFHNRINIFWYPNYSLSGTLQFRNRFMYGQSIQATPGYAAGFEEDNNFLDLSWNIFDGGARKVREETTRVAIASQQILRQELL